MSIHKYLSFLIYPVIFFGSTAAIIFFLALGYSTTFSILFVQALAAIVVFSLELLMPYKKDWNQSQKDIITDTIHYFVNYLIKQVALLLYAFLIENFIFFGVWPIDLPFTIQIIIALISIDLFLYIVHRVSHYNNLLWDLHSIHHSSKRLYWINGEKRHPLHQILEGLPGITFVMLLGAPKIVVITALGILSIHMMLQHANIDYSVGILKYLFAVAENHRLHHRLEHSQVNFGAMLMIWDHIFGSADLEIERVEKVGIYGLEQFPTQYLLQLFWPLKKK
ncbi:MAG: sterol desaturase family protein [Blastocatellia bacterium]|nr:sterol desaturase family protein [Blastocatellia bacterium]